VAANTATGRNGFTSVVVVTNASVGAVGGATAGSTCTGATSRTRLMDIPGDETAYDSGRFTSCDLVDVTNMTAVPNSPPTGGPSGFASGANDASAGWSLTYSSIDEKTVTSATIQAGCVVWSSLIPQGGTVGCASAGATAAPFYQASYVNGGPNCSAAFLNSSGTAYTRSITRNVLSPPPEPAAAVSISSTTTQIRESTLEIQPGAQEVTQITTSTSSDSLQMVYTIPLTQDLHVCRHVDSSKCQ
jgi:hypothetical protein